MINFPPMNLVQSYLICLLIRFFAFMFDKQTVIFQLNITFTMISKRQKTDLNQLIHTKILKFTVICAYYQNSRVAEAVFGWCWYL